MKITVDNPRFVQLPAELPPLLCVVVDTEEEFDWAQPFDRNSTTVEAIAAQPRIHERLYDQLGVVPTYVIDWPVASTASSVQVLKTLQQQGRCEIGAHLHPWVSPPHLEAVSRHNSFTGNLPPELEFEKLRCLTEEITTNFARAPITFKAGRYGLGKHTFSFLHQLGYQIDASVVPYTSFAHEDGPDFQDFSNTPFLFGPSESPLLELPVTTGYVGMLERHGDALWPLLQSNWGRHLRLGGIAARSRMLQRIRLSPEGFSETELRRLIDAMLHAGMRVLTLTYHSPSLQPGHTPYVRSQDDLERFLQKIENVLVHFKTRWNGQFASLSEAREQLFAAALAPASPTATDPRTTSMHAT